MLPRAWSEGQIVVRAVEGAGRRGFPLRLGACLPSQCSGLAILDSIGVYRNRPSSWELCRPRLGEGLYRPAGIAWRVADPSDHADHGLIISIPQRSKCPTFLVAMDAPLQRAMAAI